MLCKSAAAVVLKDGLRSTARSARSYSSQSHTMPNSLPAMHRGISSLRILHTSSPVSLHKPQSLQHAILKAPFSSSARLGQKPSNTDYRGPPSSESTQTDFAKLDVFGDMAVPTTSIDACLSDGFKLNSGLIVTGAGVLLVAGDALRWRPWMALSSNDTAGPVKQDGKTNVTNAMRNAKGQWHVDDAAWGVLSMVWPRPDLLILGTGKQILPVSPESRRAIGELGIRLEVQNTRNAAAQFNLLAIERGVQQVAAALVPIGPFTPS